VNALLLVLCLAPAELDAPVAPDALTTEVRGAELSAGYAFGVGRRFRVLASARADLSSAIAQPRVGLLFDPAPWLALRLDAGPLLGVAPLDLGGSARALATFNWRPGPALLYLGPLVDIGGTFAPRGGRTRMLLTTGVGGSVGPATLIVVADLGYTFAAADTGALHASAGLALQWRFGPDPEPL
jgi:hypothetical protein